MNDHTNVTRTQVFPLASGTGFAASVHGNIVRITTRGRSTYDAHVYAFSQDANGNYQTFDSIPQAVSWAITTAATHVGKPNPYSKAEFWEIRDGVSITIHRTESGAYKPNRHPIWIDSDHVPIMGLTEIFPSLDEALTWVRKTVDEENLMEKDHQALMQEILAAMTAALPS